MSFDSFRSLPAESSEIRQQTDHRERLIAVLATSLGVLTVVGIAVLMGMA
jgi:hypothetical protein